ncbi:MAG: hypothetical protein EHM75_09765 [Desulfobacteraceae bacterium]|nr:MAG: hypothetical protein EHM75_09765 [Desulfobacteraceae bacterium]
MKRYGVLFFSLVLLFAFPVSSPSFWPEQWSLRTPTLKGVVHGDGKWVAVGVSGGIYTSADRIHWEKKSSPTDQQLNRIIHTWNPDLFLAVGENGTILTSPDGISWTKQNSNTGSSLNGIAYNGNNRFVAVGSTGTIVTSTNGTAWSSVSSGIIDSLNDIAYAASKFVAVGSRTTVLNSPDGLIWGKKVPGCTQNNTQDFRAVAAGNGLFVAVGEGICYSPDGQSWSGEDQHPLRNLNDVTYESSRFIATGSSGEMLTSDATPYTWTTRTPNTKNDLYGITYDVTSKGLAAVGNGGLIVTSDNGNDWTRLNPDLLSIAFDRGRYVAVGTWGTIRTSADGVNWQNQTSNTAWSLRGITSGQNQFVVAGDGGSILTSPDGTTWTPQNSTSADFLFGITYGDNGKFVAVGLSDKVHISSNGSVWQDKPLGTTYWLNGITYGNGKYVSVGLGGAILTSADGDTWEPKSSSTTEWLLGVAYGNGLFVAVGTKGTILTSPDGHTWTPFPDPQKVFCWDILGITFKYGRFVAVNANGAVLTSLNGTSWSLKETWNMAGATKDPLRSVVGGLNSFMTVGEGGIILESENTGFPLFLPLILR